MNLNMKNKTFSVHDVVLIGVLAACVFVLTKFISIPIPSPLGKTALSVGNAMCILSALLFGPLTGGLAAGIGNALVDLSDPAWAPEFWITFINKFLMAFVAGIIMHKVPVIASKALTYCVLYVTKNIISGIYVKGFTPAVAIGETLALKLPVTFVNAVIAMACGALLYFALKSPLQKAHVV